MESDQRQAKRADMQGCQWSRCSRAGVANVRECGVGFCVCLCVCVWVWRARCTQLLCVSTLDVAAVYMSHLQRRSWGSRPVGAQRLCLQWQAPTTCNCFLSLWVFFWEFLLSSKSKPGRPGSALLSTSKGRRSLCPLLRHSKRFEKGPAQLRGL